jgi:hypothetical protein
MRHNTTYAEINSEIKNKFYKDILKPIHLYSYMIVPKPNEIFKNVYRQTCYSECAIIFKNDKEIFMKSRPATPQFKEIKNIGITVPENCFSNLYAWYCPWFIDIDAEVEFVEPNIEDYPFFIPEKKIVNFKKIYPEPRMILEPIWIPFFVKKESSAIKKTYGKIDRLTPAYDMVIK